jgi:mono/diheme cytochrome c family protein
MMKTMRPSLFLFLSFPWLLAAALAADATGKGADSAVTFSKDIAPIIFNNCTACHRPGEAAPFPFTNYTEVKKRGRLIAAVTKDRYMPPWHAEPADVEYRDERRLSDEQIARVQAWVEQSMPEGDPKDLPALPRFSEGWQLGEPDLVLEMEEPYQVPADGRDIYHSFAIPTDLPEDKWIRAIEYRPRARGSSHHAFFIIDTSGQALAADRAHAGPGFDGLSMFVQFADWGAKDFFRTGTAGGGNNLGTWVLGSSPRVLPDGLGYELPKGSTFVVHAHFHPSGKPEVEQASIGIHFTEEPPTRTLTGIHAPSAMGRYARINIPAGDPDYTVEASFTIPIDIDVYGAGGHTHYLGKQLKMTAVLPDGQSKTLLRIDRWDFNWQDRYFFREPLPLPAGTRLDVVIKYDNSAQNPFNPYDPPRRVRWGLSSEEEMAGMSIEVVPRREKDLPLLEAAKTEALRSRDAVVRSSIEKRKSMSTVMKRYDKDGDGKLSDEERKALFDALSKRSKKTPKPEQNDN